MTVTWAAMSYGFEMVISAVTFSPSLALPGTITLAWSSRARAEESYHENNESHAHVFQNQFVNQIIPYVIALPGYDINYT